VLSVYYQLIHLRHSLNPPAQRGLCFLARIAHCDYFRCAVTVAVVAIIVLNNFPRVLRHPLDWVILPLFLILKLAAAVIAKAVDLATIAFSLIQVSY